MKKLSGCAIALFLIMSLQSCKKCSTCNTTLRTITQYKSYSGYNIGTPIYSTVSSSKEVCGKDNIENADGVVEYEGTGTGLSNYAGSYSVITYIEQTDCQ
jgi:hypothetical protein